MPKASQANWKNIFSHSFELETLNTKSWTRVRAACASSADAAGASLQVKRKMRLSNCALGAAGLETSHLLSKFGGRSMVVVLYYNDL